MLHTEFAAYRFFKKTRGQCKPVFKTVTGQILPWETSFKLINQERIYRRDKDNAHTVPAMFFL